MDYIVFKFNFICKLKLKFEIWNCNFNLQFQITRVHNIHYMNLKLNFNCNLRFQIAISICNWNWLLGIFWQVHLKWKVFFNLWYGLHRFQIQFHLQIEISKCNFNLQFKVTHVHDIHYINLKLNFNCIAIAIWDFILQFQFAIEIECWENFGMFT